MLGMRGNPAGCRELIGVCVKARKKRGDGGFSFHSCPFNEEGKKFLFGVRGQGISFKEIDSKGTSITTEIEVIF